MESVEGYRLAIIHVGTSTGLDVGHGISRGLPNGRFRLRSAPSGERLVYTSGVPGVLNLLAVILHMHYYISL